MLDSTSSYLVETAKGPETLESPLPDIIQVQVLQEIGDVIVVPRSITPDNATGISKCLIQDDHFRKRLIHQIKDRIFMGRAVTDKDFEVIENDDAFRMTTLSKLIMPTDKKNRLYLIDGLSTQKINGEERVVLNIRQTKGKKEITFDSINNRVMADILKVVLFEEEGEITDTIV